MADQILLDIINEHLPYEIDMLRSTYRQVQIAAKNQASETLEQRVHRFSFIESFCIHARSLIDFFENHQTHPTDVSAANFTIGFATNLDRSKEPLKTLRAKLNKQIFHLTTDRTILTADKFDGGVDGRAILNLIEPEIVRFTSCLASDFKTFRCTTDAILFPVGYLPQRTSTATVTTSVTSVNPPSGAQIGATGDE
jgi:hypothetical protein